MKKLTVLVVVLILLTLNTIPACAEGITVASDNGDRVSLFDDIKVEKSITGNVITVLGNIDVDNDINGQVIAVFGNITVNARVSGQVTTIFGNTKLTKNAVVQGNLITLGSVVKDDGSKVLGQEVMIVGEYMNVDFGAILYLRLALLMLFALAVLIIGLVILMVSRKRFEEITKSIEYNMGKKLILGFLAYTGASILLALLLITLIAPALYIILMVLATVVASIFSGRLILKAMNPSNSVYMEFVTGLITITLIKLLFIFLVPQEEIILSFVLVGVFGVLVNSIGLGVLMEARFGKK